MNNQATGIFALLLTVGAAAASGADAQPCSADWYRFVEQKVISSDGQGHGPDPGSDEWKSVIEFRLGIRGQPGIPPRDSDEWCRYIDRQVRAL